MSTETPLLTIGIPSYRRPAEVATLVGDMLSGGVGDVARILVIDDGPDADVQAALAPFADRIHLHVHDENRGYAATFADLFELCETPWLMVTADDDTPDADEIRRTAELLQEHPVDFASTLFPDRHGAIYRGRRSTAAISLAEIRWASGHAPGLVYRAGTARRLLPFLTGRLALGCYAAKIYPQTVLAYLMCLSSPDCRWLPTAPFREGAERPSQLRDADGTRYNSVAGRMREQLAYSEMFGAMAGFLDTDEARARIAAVSRLHAQDIYRRLTREIRREHPEVIGDWIAGSFFFNRRGLPGHLLRLWRWRRARRAARTSLRAADRARGAIPPETPRT
jgi:glycosyltransferase involved in cell wall biosynthesis